MAELFTYLKYVFLHKNRLQYDTTVITYLAKCFIIGLWLGQLFIFGLMLQLVMVEYTIQAVMKINLSSFSGKHFLTN
jgi:hypothetical protein